MSTEPDLRSFLTVYFPYEEYAAAIATARAAVARGDYGAHWDQIAASVRNRALAPGEPLRLVHQAANQVLDDNTDDEAYVWLDKMVENVERTDGVIDEY
jgi:hypothetical protein